MKKSTLLVALAMLCGLNMAAADGDSQWINYLDGPTASGVCPLKVAYDANSVYWLSTAGTADGNQTITYNGETLFEGSKSTTTSANHNVCLIKLNKAGEKLYTVYSNSGETWTNQNGVVPTSDGGAVIALRMRHALGYESEPINFVDAKGNNYAIDWECNEEEGRYNALIVLKLDSEGVIEWDRFIDMERLEVNDQKAPVASVDLLSVVGDNEGNIYLGGRYVMPMHFPKADGTEVVITPDNMNNYNGDFTQYDNGDLFLVKLDSDGYFVKNVANKGILLKGSVQSMVWSDGALYTLSFMKGAEGETVEFGGFSLSPLPNVYNLVLSKFDSDLNAEWMSIYTGERDTKYSANVIQNTSIFKAGDNLWIGGMGNGIFKDPVSGVSVTSNNKSREGYLFKASAKNGQLVAANTSSSYMTKTGIVGYFGAIQNPSGSGDVYTYGYDWNMAAQAPFFLRAFDSNSLEYKEDASFNLITGMTLAVFDLAYDPTEGVVYYTARSKGTPAPAGLEPSEKAVNWKGFIGKAILPESMKVATSAIESVSVYEGIEISAVANGLAVTNNGADTELSVYDVAGRQVASVPVASASTITICLPRGLYIAGGRKLLVK